MVSIQGPAFLGADRTACFVRYGGVLTFNPESGAIEVRKSDPGCCAMSASFHGIIRRYEDVEFNVPPSDRCGTTTGGLRHPD